jgi:type IV secretory pathway VirB10-like protein
MEKLQTQSGIIRRCRRYTEPMRHKPLFIALIGLVLAASAHAQWKWRDAKGNVQYSDRPPPPGTLDKDILQRPAAASRNVVIVPAGQPASAAASAPKPAASAPTKAEQDAAARAKQEQDKEAAKQKEEERRVAAQRRENCSRAQAGLRDLQSGTRITRTNDKGERVFMDEAQIAVEVARARDVISSECR